jgi:hypothetical protein
MQLNPAPPAWTGLTHSYSSSHSCRFPAIRLTPSQASADLLNVAVGKGSVYDWMAADNQRACVRFEGSTTRLGQGTVSVALISYGEANPAGVRWHIPVIVQNDADFCTSPHFEYGYAEEWSAG